MSGMGKQGNGEDYKTRSFIISFSRGSMTAVCLGLLHGVCRPHSDIQHPGGLLWTSDESDAETST